jgi:hypothetical protein
MTREEEDEAIYAVALVTRSELAILGPAFARAWPVERTPCFGELLAAIDEADREHWHKEDNSHQPSVAAQHFSAIGTQGDLGRDPTSSA